MLVVRGALVPMVQEMLWAGTNYSAANRTIYGSVIWGYDEFFRGAREVDVIAAGVAMTLFAAPALVPAVAAAGLMLSRQFRTARILWRAACATGAIATTAPRMDVGHIAFSTTVAWVVAECALMRLPERRAYRTSRCNCVHGSWCSSGASGSWEN